MLNIESRINEYYERTLRLKPLISADQDMLKRIMSAVNHQYDDNELDDSVKFLGEGISNKVYNIGSIIDPENQQEIPIAMRLQNIVPLYLKSNHFRSQLEKELKEYEAAYALGENTPYFISVVTFLPYGDSAPKLRSCAVITEDISKKRTLPLEKIDRSRVERTNEDESKEVFFIDPHEFIELDRLYDLNTMAIVNRISNGEKYLEDRARIDLLNV